MGAHRRMRWTDPSTGTGRRNPSTVGWGHPRRTWMDPDKDHRHLFGSKEKEKTPPDCLPPSTLEGGGVDLLHSPSRSTLFTEERNERQVETSGDSRSNRIHAYPNTIHRPGRHRTKKQRDGDDNTTQNNNKQSTTSDTSTWQNRPWLWRNANQTKTNHQTKKKAP